MSETANKFFPEGWLQTDTAVALYRSEREWADDPQARNFAHFSGMLAFVMDGNVSTAKKAVEAQIGRKSEDLGIDGEAKIHASGLMPKGSHHGETHHVAASKKAFCSTCFSLAVVQPV